MARQLLSSGGLSVGPHRPRRFERPEELRRLSSGGGATAPASESSEALEIPEDLTTIDALVAWVKEDDTAARARLVLDTENAKDKPRVTLARQLEEILSDGDGNDLL